MYIEDIRIGQVVYVEGDKRKLIVSKIDGDSYEVYVKRIDENDYPTKDCSYVDIGNLTDKPPKEKKRYWLWAVYINYWYCCEDYLDEDGKRTDGNLKYPFWNRLEKKKIENMYIEI